MYNTSVPYMETERLILRETKPSDFKDMFEYAHLPYIGPVAGWAPHRTLGETRGVLKLFNDKKSYGQLGTIAVIWKENNKMIGTVELHTFIAGFKAELGYTINSFLTYLFVSYIFLEPPLVSKLTLIFSLLALSHATNKINIIATKIKLKIFISSL